MAFDRSVVKGLPEGSSVQVIKGVPYVYFRYQWKDSTGKVKYARDYLGTVEDNQFIPNDYYLRLRPTKNQRPQERWSQAQRKQMAVSAISNDRSEQGNTDKQQADCVKPEGEIQTKSIGVTALAAAILDTNGMIDDALDMFGGDVNTVTQLLNIAMGAAITAKPTYLSADESRVQLFFGNQLCPTSPRASELHQKIGDKLDLSARISKRRIARLGESPLLALDGSRIDCGSKNIIEAVVGRRKNGLYAAQINFSLLVDASTGAPVGYRYFSGTTNDVSTLEDFTTIWNAYGLLDKDPMIVVDRGYYSQEGLIRLGRQGYRFLAGAKTGYSLVKTIIENRNSEFYEASSLLESADFYGIQETKTLQGKEGKLDVNVSVFRNPVEEMAATRRLFKRLSKFEADWIQGKADPNDELIAFYEKPEPGKALKRNMTQVTQECFLLGYFAFVSNAMDHGLERALDIYKLRNEAEVVFKLMLGNLLRTTRVHSTQALEGLLFTTFLALSILTSLRVRMKADLNGQPVASSYTIAEVFARLKKIQLIELEGKRYLINVSAKDKQLVKALGFEGLYDSPQDALKPLMRLA